MSRRISYRLPRRRYSERRKRMVWVWLRPIVMRDESRGQRAKGERS